MTPRRAAAWAAVALIAALVAVYGRTAGYPFISLDDDLYVYRNPIVRAGWTLEGLGWAWTTGHASNWHPLTWISHMLDSEIHGTWAGGHHATSVLLHAINTLLLFGLLSCATGATWRPLLVAALFALHPLRVESVAWVAERKDLLSALFGFAATWAWVTWTRRGGAGRYALACLAFAASLMSKPMLVTLPFVFLLLDDWPLARSGGRVPLGRRVVEKLPFFSLSAASCAITLVVQRSTAASGLVELPLPLRLANACVSYARYLSKIAWPVDLSPFYPFPGREVEPWSPAAIGGALLLLAGVTALILRSRRRYAAFGWWFFLGTLVPVIGLVQVGMQAMADRYVYVPAIGIFVIVAWGAGELRPRVAIPAAMLVLVACLAATWVQVGYWRDSITLFRHGLAAAPGASTLHNNLGVVLTTEGRFEEAAREFRRVTEIAPLEADGHFNLGLALARTGDTAGAVAALEQARRLRPDLPMIDLRLGEILRDAGRGTDAVRHIEAALRARPDWVAALEALAWILATDPDPQVRRPERALALAERARYLSPAPSATTLDTLAAAQAAAGRFDLAIATLERALALAGRPDDPQHRARSSRLALYREGRPFIASGPR